MGRGIFKQREEERLGSRNVYYTAIRPETTMGEANLPKGIAQQ
jgi:hypothetical protein